MSHMKQFSNSFVYSYLSIGGSLVRSLMAFWNSQRSQFSSIQSFRGYAYNYTRWHQHSFSVRVIPFWIKLQAAVVNASAVKLSKTLLNANWRSLLPDIPAQPSHNSSTSRLKDSLILTSPIKPDFDNHSA